MEQETATIKSVTLPEENEKFNWKKELMDWAEVVVSSVIIVVILFTFVFRVVGISGPSMKNTLNSDWLNDQSPNSDKVIISNLFYKPKIGDIVVVSRNWNNNAQLDASNVTNDPIVKRVVGVAGDYLYIDGQYLYRDGKPEAEDSEGNPVKPAFARELIDVSVNQPTITMTKDNPYQVPAGTVFLMGDNRNQSADSRSMLQGAVSTKYILGHVLFRIFPFNKIGPLYNK